MDGLLARVTQQAMNYAIRSGITLTTTYALRQSTRLVRRAADSADKAELEDLQERLEARIRIVAPAIDLIELISARGNTSLCTAVNLTRSLRWAIQRLGQHIAATGETDSLQPVLAELRRVLARIEDAIPLINLAITTSGATLSGTLPPGISPSRLLQASTFVTAGDSAYVRAVSHAGGFGSGAANEGAGAPGAVQIGPTFTLSLYMLFAGHVRPETEADVRNTTWKEVLHKARVKLVRVPLDNLYDLPDSTAQTATRIRGTSRADEFAYQMLIVEDLDDERVHTYEEDEPRPGPYGDVALAGIREPLPIHEISKIFYADTGKILNIGDDVETNSPVLLLKRDINAVPPRRMLEREDMERSWADAVLNGDVDEEATPSKPTSSKPHGQWRIPKDLDPEWLAFEVFLEDASSDSGSDEDVFEPSTQQQKEQGGSKPSPSATSHLTSAMSNLKLHTPSPRRLDADSPQPDPSKQLMPARANTRAKSTNTTPTLTLPPIRTSLSLLETLLRLLSLQQFQQASHLSIPDELLSFFLSEATSTTGAAHGDHMERRQLRHDARRRVGFDPYDESPIKRRGEDYQHRYRGGKSQDGGEANWRGSGLGQDKALELELHPELDSDGELELDPEPEPVPVPVLEAESSPQLPRKPDQWMRPTARKADDHHLSSTTEPAPTQKRSLPRQAKAASASPALMKAATGAAAGGGSEEEDRGKGKGKGKEKERVLSTAAEMPSMAEHLQSLGSPTVRAQKRRLRSMDALAAARESSPLASVEGVDAQQE